MIGGVVVYGVLSAENRVFEQELERKRRWHEALQAIGENGGPKYGRRGIAGSLRSMMSRNGGSGSFREVPAGC